jgi:hypothetical protein
MSNHCLSRLSRGNVGGERFFRHRTRVTGTGSGGANVALAENISIGKQTSATAENSTGDEQDHATSDEGPQRYWLDTILNDSLFAGARGGFADDSPMSLGHIDRVLKVWCLLGQRHE